MLRIISYPISKHPTASAWGLHAPPDPHFRDLPHGFSPPTFKFVPTPMPKTISNKYILGPGGQSTTTYFAADGPGQPILGGPSKDNIVHAFLVQLRTNSTKIFTSFVVSV